MSTTAAQIAAHFIGGDGRRGGGLAGEGAGGGGRCGGRLAGEGACGGGRCGKLTGERATGDLRAVGRAGGGGGASTGWSAEGWLSSGGPERGETLAPCALRTRRAGCIYSCSQTLMSSPIIALPTPPRRAPHAPSKPHNNAAPAQQPNILRIHQPIPQPAVGLESRASWTGRTYRSQQRSSLV